MQQQQLILPSTQPFLFLTKKKCLGFWAKEAKKIFFHWPNHYLLFITGGKHYYYYYRDKTLKKAALTLSSF